MKTKEELNTLKEEVKALNKKLAELTEEELAQVTGGKTAAGFPAESGTSSPFGKPSGEKQYDIRVYPSETEEDARKKFFGN